MTSNQVTNSSCSSGLMLDCTYGWCTHHMLYMVRFWVAFYLATKLSRTSHITLTI